MGKINLLLPVEIIARELDYKLFLAASFAKKDVNVILAQQDFFNSGCFKFKGGVYIGKNIFKMPFIAKGHASETDLRWYNELKKNDITFIHLDEEAAIWSGEEEEWKYELDIRLNPDVLKDMDYIFTWGGFQAKHFQNKSSLFPSSHIINSGHPKYDLCKPKFRDYYKEEIDKIKGKYGSFILINTKTGMPNHVSGLKGVFEILPDAFYTNYSYQRAQLVREWAYQNKVLTDFVTLLHKLCAIFPDKTFVVRPSPAEDPEYYRHVLTGVDNIFVDKTGTVNPWIMAADLVIHNECTTGVETFLSEIPLVSYKSVENKEFEIILPNQCGVKCTREEEVIKAINDAEQDPESFAQKNSFTNLSRSLLKNFESDTYEDFVNLVGKIIEDKRIKNTYSGEISILKFRLGEVLYDLEQYCRTMIRRFFPEKLRKYRSARAHFPGFDKGFIGSKILLIESILDKKVVVNYLSDRLMVVTSADDEK